MNTVGVEPDEIVKVLICNFIAQNIQRSFLELVNILINVLIDNRYYIKILVY